MSNEGGDEKHHKYRCRELQRQLEELEEYNDILEVKLQRAHKRLRRMKVERNVLLERFEQTKQYEKRDSMSSDSDAPLKNTFPRASDNDEVVGVRRRRGGYTQSNGSTTPRQAGEPGGRKPRAEKDPNAPKRPANAFVLYCQVERPNIKSAGTELSSSELTRSMGVKWRGLPKDEKQKYYDLYEREMARYQREMDSYKGSIAAKLEEPRSSPLAEPIEEDAPPNPEPPETEQTSDAVTPTTAIEREDPGGKMDPHLYPETPQIAN
ncbi:non-histone protein [Coemansia brasiliensis]|uniref:Non-histone protein n=1 Tax=Coemansia brasiliensis TaxID=2650707 RepID=A0A9W8I4D1_9FUNG|nr:non-histone protein [Coemansia brasiliensis]